MAMGEPHGFQMWTEFLEGVKTGQTAFDLFHGMGIFEYYAQNPEQGRNFDAAMTSLSAPEAAAVVAGYDFSGIGTLVDVAGGHGSLLSTILKSYPAMKGVLADVPAVIEGALRQHPRPP